MKKERESNFEFLRIICMLMIVLLHTLGHGGGLTNTNVNSFNFFISHLIESLSIVAVNVYVIITGYFSINKTKINIYKLLILYAQMYFYSILISSVFILIKPDLIDLKQIINSVLPFSTQLWWFMSIYLVLSLLTPYINRLLIVLRKRELDYLIAILFFIFILWPSGIKILKPIDDSGGYSLYHFIFMYIVGAYINLRWKEKSFKKVLSSIIYISGSILLAIINVFISRLLGRNFGVYSYNFILIFITSVALFLFFKEIKLKNKFINRISILTLGIYLIHDHPLVRKTIYDVLGYSRSFNTNNYILTTIIVALVIFILCMIIELARQYIFNFIGKNLLTKRCNFSQLIKTKLKF